MSGLYRSIVEHRLPIKSRFLPHQQPTYRCNPNILPNIKAEITKLIEASIFGNVGMPNGLPMLSLSIKRMESFVSALALGISIKPRRWMVIQCQLPIW